MAWYQLQYLQWHYFKSKWQYISKLHELHIAPTSPQCARYQMEEDLFLAPWQNEAFWRAHLEASSGAHPMSILDVFISAEKQGHNEYYVRGRRSGPDRYSGKSSQRRPPATRGIDAKMWVLWTQSPSSIRLSKHDFIARHYLGLWGYIKRRYLG
jgi:hypothetical protein